MPRRRLVLAILLSLTVATAYVACTSPVQVVAGDTVDLGIEDGAVRLILIGDSGTFGPDTGPCVPTTQVEPLPERCRDDLLASIADEEADAILALGDLVYEAGPRCPGGKLTAAARDELDVLLGELADRTNTPLLPVLGNHDVAQSVTGNAASEACYLLWAAERDDVFLPERNYVIDAGPLRMVAMDTNRSLDPRFAAELMDDLDAIDAPWTAYAGHHVWKTYFDKQAENHGPRFSDVLGERPDLWLNGHAHLLQFGVYDGVAAVTSGASGKLRLRQECEGAACASWDGLAFAASQYGYAVLDVTEFSARVTFKDVQGDPLFAWERSLDDPEGLILSTP